MKEKETIRGGNRRTAGILLMLALTLCGCAGRNNTYAAPDAAPVESTLPAAAPLPVETDASPQDILPEEKSDAADAAQVRMQETFAGDWAGMTVIWLFDGEDPLSGENWQGVSAETFARIAFADETGEIGLGIDSILPDGLSFEDVTTQIDYDRGWIVLRGSFLGVPFETYLWEPHENDPLEFDLIIEQQEEIQAAYCTVYLRRTGDDWAAYDTPMAGEEDGTRIRAAYAEMSGKTLDEITRYYENSLRRTTGERIRITLPSARRLTHMMTATDGHGIGIWEGIEGYNRDAAYEAGAGVPEQVMDAACREFSENFNMYGMTYEEIRDAYFDGIDATPTEFSDEAGYYTYLAACIWYCEEDPEKTITISFSGDDATNLTFENFIYDGFDE